MRSGPFRAEWALLIYPEFLVIFCPSDPPQHRRCARSLYTASTIMSATSTALEPLFSFLSYSYATLETNFYKIPGSAVVARYVKSSHQNDPGRTVLEIILILFAIRTLLQSRTRADNSGKHFIKFEEKVCYKQCSSCDMSDDQLLLLGN